MRSGHADRRDARTPDTCSPADVEVDRSNSNNTSPFRLTPSTCFVLPDIIQDRENRLHDQVLGFFVQQIVAYTPKFIGPRHFDTTRFFTLYTGIGVRGVIL